MILPPAGPVRVLVATRPVGDGVYEVSLAIPQAGVYYLSFQAASIGLRFNDRPPLVLQTKAAEAPRKP